MCRLLVGGIFFTYLFLSMELPLVDARPYNAAVVEYAPIGNVFSQTPSEVLGGNLNQYNLLIQQAALLGIDLIVFPEYGLTTLTLSSLSRLDARPFLQQLPPINSSADQNLCNSNNIKISDDLLVFTKLSCYSRQNAIYVVANVGEIVQCNSGQNTTENEACPTDGAFQYSSNIVFDRSGRLIARYRKTHLFLESLFQSPKISDLTVFNTDFGVNFGLFTCFDIMFYTPALNLFYEKGIKDFVFPTAWVDELPFLTAIQKQEAWSRFLGVNLLASNYHLPANGQIGSGIYNSAGAISYISSPDSGTRLITATVGGALENASASMIKVEVNSKNARWMEPRGMLYEDLTNYSSLTLEPGIDQSVFLCHGDLCCNLNYSISCSTNQLCDNYRLLSYSGFRTLGGGLYTVYIQLCGLVACADESLGSCVKPTVSRIPQIDMLELKGNFSSAHQVYPTSINKELQLLPAASLEFNSYENGEFGLTATDFISDALAIGLYGRAYDKDISI